MEAALVILSVEAQHRFLPQPQQLSKHICLSQTPREMMTVAV